jgi:hypothetical protein
MGRGLSARVDLAMPNGEQPEVQQQLRTLSPRLEELSASAGQVGGLVVPFQEKRRFETNLRGRLLSLLAKSIRG